MKRSYNVIIRRLWKKTGQIIDEEKIHNLSAGVGLERVAKLLLKSVGGTAFGYIGIGTGTTAANINDTGLETEVKRAEADDSGGSYEASYKAVWEKTFSFASGDSYAITEACISDSAGASAETILNRFVFSAKNIDWEIDLYVKVTVQIN